VNNNNNVVTSFLGTEKMIARLLRLLTAIGWCCFIAILVFPAELAQAVLVGTQRMFQGTCNGEPLVEVPIMLGEACINSHGVGFQSSIRLDCATKRMSSFNTTNCLPESLVGSQGGCSIAGEGLFYELGCLDIPADQLLSIEIGAACEGNGIVNVSQSSVFQLDRCFGGTATSGKAFAQGDFFRFESYNSSDCNSDKIISKDTYVKEKCVSKFGFGGRITTGTYARRMSANSALRAGSSTMFPAWMIAMAVFLFQ
jgi:hypothetical protein